MNKQRVRRIENPVPPMTHPMSFGWQQPDSERFKFFEVVEGGKRFVSMSSHDENKLLRYDWGFPSGVYDGKMWLCEDHLVWLESSPDKSDCCTNRSAKILTS